jgi:DNA-binding MarR family transcriptional regulator
MNMPKGPRTIYLIKRLETLIRVRLEAALQDLALTPGQYTTLSVVNVGPISSADLARRVGITPQSMSEVIALLERKGHVTRTVRDDNRRIADVGLTVSGESLLRQAEERVDIFERDLLKSLSPHEKAILRGTLEVILS